MALVSLFARELHEHAVTGKGAAELLGKVCIVRRVSSTSSALAGVDTASIDVVTETSKPQARSVAAACSAASARGRFKPKCATRRVSRDSPAPGGGRGAYPVQTCDPGGTDAENGRR